MAQGYVRRSCICAVFFIFALRAAGSAHPPSDIQLISDSDAGRLRVDMRHVTGNPRNHFIRKIIVYRNDQEAAHSTYAFQTSPAHMSADISVIAAGGDVLRARVFCNKGGIGEALLTVPEEPRENDDDAVPNESADRGE